MALSLSRNATLYLSTVESSWDGAGSSLKDANTFEIPILDGFSFSQATGTQNVTLNEAGTAPRRGQKIFNTSLEPVDWSFTTYVRPFKDTADSSKHSCTEALLWNGLVSNAKSDYAGNGLSNDTTDLSIDFETSEAANQLLKMYGYFRFSDSGLTYKLSKMCVTSASIDFDIDGIAQISWSGYASAIEEVGVTYPDTAGTDFVAAQTDADFILNRLSTVSLSSDLDAATGGRVTAIGSVTAGSGYTSVPTAVFAAAPTGGRTAKGTATISVGGAVTGVTITDGGAGYTTGPTISFTGGGGTGASVAACTIVKTAVTYAFALTGGNVTIDNGITYVTPEELGKINTPIDHQVGTRAISGSFTAYLDSSSTGTKGIYDDMKTDLDSLAPDATNSFNIDLNIGGTVAGEPQVQFSMGQAHFELPSIDTSDVMGVTMNFTALETDFAGEDELTINYKGKTVT